MKVGPRSTMQVHMGDCAFGKIECPEWSCKRVVTYEGVVDHLKDTHFAKLLGDIVRDIAR